MEYIHYPSTKRLLIRRLTKLCCISVLYLALTGVAFFWHRWNSDDLLEPQHPGHKRVKRAADLTQDVPLNCTPRAVDNFFGNFMTLEDTQSGGVVVHILIAFYLIGGLALICDDYFVVSLERICEDLQIEADVAGATFMAAGSSAAEFFTSVIGVFIAKSDVGVGTIVGSAVFNLLFIIGVCGLFAGVVVQLTWWPVFRDTSYYLLSVLALVLIIEDGLVHWYEALVLFIMCILYFIILACNRRLEGIVHRGLDAIRTRCTWSRDEDLSAKTPLLQEKDSVGNSDSTVGTEETTFSTEVDTEVDTRSTISEGLGSQSFAESPEDSNQSLPNHHSPWVIPERFPRRLFWVAMLPIKFILYVTVPDCRRKTKWRKLYLGTFVMSVLWIAVFSYVLVWMVTIAGDALEIPDTVMGLTFLSAGTSVPDCLASLYVARDGLGDMAVSNSIASNVFNILMCLGLPWLLETAIVNTGERVPISSGGLVYDSLILLVTVAFLIMALFTNRWKLNVKLGIFCIVSYVVVTGVSCLFELNVFGELNLPSCPR